MKEKLERFKRFFRKPKKTMQIPKEWVHIEGEIEQEDGSKAKAQVYIRKKNVDSPFVKVQLERSKRVFHVPGLRWIKRLLAGFLMFFYFLISQFTLFSGGENAFMAIIFLVTSFLCADYIWKTRRKIAR